jgi:hypothetical protein
VRTKLGNIVALAGKQVDFLLATNIMQAARFVKIRELHFISKPE